MADNEVSVFFLPFHLETYAPVTVETIEKQAMCVMRISPTATEARQMKTLLRAVSEGAFDDNVVRLKVVNLEISPIYVDQDGGVLKQPGKEAQLPPDAFLKLKTVLKELAKAQCPGLDAG